MKVVMSRLLTRTTAPFHEFGFIAGTLYLADRLLQRASPRLGLFVYELMAQPISETSFLPRSIAKHLEAREIHPGDPVIESMPAKSEIKRLRFQQNAKCLGAYYKGELVGYVWLTFGSYDEDEVRCTYMLPSGNDSTFDFDLYVLPERRMGVGFASIWHLTNRYLHERGIHFTFSRMTRFNTLSRQSHSRLGARRVGSAIFLKLGTMQIMFATVRPYVSISLSQRRPKLHLKRPAFPGAQP